MKLKKILIMAGGTGGHVYPALATAHTFREQGIEVHWLGTIKGLEAKVVPVANIPLHFISISGLRGKKLKDLLFVPWRLISAILQSIKIIRQLQPDVVLGFGGFVSGPGGIASVFLRKKLVIHEQNAKVGLTNQWLSKVATKILEGFPNTFLESSKVITTGNPVRKAITQLPSPDDRLINHNDDLRLLVLGGSLGASAINELVPQAIAKFPLDKRPQIKHQTGEKHYTDTLRIYEKMSVKAEVMPFIDDMAAVYDWADIILCRAGASTIAELCAVGVGAILVPYPYAVDDHQTANAHFLVKNGAAIMVQQKDLIVEILTHWIERFSESKEKRLLMAQSAYKLRKIDVTDRIVKICEEICH